MEVPEDLDVFCDLLVAATSRIAKDYFMLRIADGEGGEPLMSIASACMRTSYISNCAQRGRTWRYSLGGRSTNKGTRLFAVRISTTSNPICSFTCQARCERTSSWWRLRHRGPTRRGMSGLQLRLT